MRETLQAGRLLVATPSLEEPTFHHSVIYLLAHGDEGALGVVLNRANDVPVKELLPGWSDLATPPDCLFTGGPVQRRSSVIGLARLRPDVPDGLDGCQPISGLIATLDLNRSPEEIAPAVEGVRLFSGYAGWDSQQLERELAYGSWCVVGAGADDVFTAQPDDLWRGVLRRQGGRLAMYAKAPPMLSMN